MTDPILAGLMLTALAACIGFAVRCRWQQVVVERQRRRCVFRGVNRFQSQTQPDEIWLLN